MTESESSGKPEDSTKPDDSTKTEETTKPEKTTEPEETTEPEKLKYMEKNSEYWVIGIGNRSEKEVVTSATYNGKPVTGIGDGAFHNCVKGTSKNQFPVLNFAIQESKNEIRVANRIPTSNVMYMPGVEAPKLRAYPAKGYSYPAAASFRLKKK